MNLPVKMRPLKVFPILLLLLLGDGLFAGDIVVFGEKDFYPLQAGPGSAGPKQADHLAFFEGCQADLGRQAAFEKAMELVSPPAWGKTVSASTRGTIRFHPAFPSGFVCHLSLESLLPDHDYILTLNGNPEKAGNELLLSAVPGNEMERYYDFLMIRTDPLGHYDAGLGIFLKPGKYDVRCYVKDTSDFKIVLYRDFFEFAVK
jgi:hypothetical protein